MISHLKALVMMQLKDKMDLSFLHNRRRLIFKCVLSVLLVAAVTAVIYLLFWLAVSMRIFSFWAELPVTVVGVVFIAMFLLSVLSATAGLTKTLYFTKDNQVLLTFPVPANWVFVSKLIIFYIFELKRNAVFSLPLFIAYGLVNGFAVYYYFWAAIGLVFVSLLPVLIGAVLSIPAMFAYRFIKRCAWLQAALFARRVCGGGVAAGVPHRLDSRKHQHHRLVGHAVLPGAGRARFRLPNLLPDLHPRDVAGGQNGRLHL